MVLQVGADALERMHYRNSERSEQIRGTDPRQLQQVRRRHRAGREDRFPTDVESNFPPSALGFDADTAPAVEDEPGRERRGEYREVRAAGHRLQKRARRIPANAATLVDVE